MQLTPRETKVIERWRKQERLWPRTRWILIGLGAAFFACYGYLAYLLFSTLDPETFSPADSALMFAVFWPTVILMSVVGAKCVVTVVMDWHGNVQRRLLLKLLDVHQKEIV